MQGITYNTTMGLVVGIILILAVLFLRVMQTNTGRSVAGFGWGFIFSGAFLGATGLHMTLTWPLEQIDGVFCCAVDNVTFGEPAAFYGILTLIAGLAILRAEDRADRGIRAMDLVGTLRPLLVAVHFGTGSVVSHPLAGRQCPTQVSEWPHGEQGF